MADRFFAKVVSVIDDYSVVINKGENAGVKEGDVFLVVGLGELVSDPDTGEELERLEIVRGKAKVSHVQQSMSTVTSCSYHVDDETREIKKVTTRSNLSILGPQDTVTESIKPGERRLKALRGVAVGDMVLKR